MHLQRLCSHCLQSVQKVDQNKGHFVKEKPAVPQQKNEFKKK